MVTHFSIIYMYPFLDYGNSGLSTVHTVTAIVTFRESVHKPRDSSDHFALNAAASGPAAWHAPLKALTILFAHRTAASRPSASMMGLARCVMAEWKPVAVNAIGAYSPSRSARSSACTGLEHARFSHPVS